MEPDVASGDLFTSELVGGGHQVKRCIANIVPRVLGDKINPSDQVSKDLQEVIDSCAAIKADTMVIACNTLQLWLPRVNTRGLKVLTTFEVVDNYIKETKTNPIWLGTWPLVREIDKTRRYKTLSSMGETDLQNLVQELIWRVKGVEGSDISGAGEIELIKDEKKMVERGTSLFDCLKVIKCDGVVLGCTELPILVDKYLKDYDFGELILINPAKLMAENLKGSGS